MKHLGLLLKNNFITTFGINKIFKVDKKKLIIYSILGIYLIATLLYTFTNYAISTSNFLTQYNLLSFMITIFFTITSFSIFMFTIYNSKNSLFSARDNNFLLSLPIKTQTIIASRLINLIIWNFLIAILFLGPALIIYANKINESLIYYLNAVIIFIMVPIIPTILASVVGYIIAYLTSKSNKKNYFEIILSFIFVFAFFYIMSNGEKILNFLVNDIEKMEMILKWVFYPIYLVNEIFANNSFTSLIIFILINIGLLLLFIILLDKNYKKIIIRLQENKTKVNYTLRNIKASSVNKALLIKEFRRYMSSPIYVLNTSFGIILILVLALATFIYDADQVLGFLGMSVGPIDSFQLVVLLVAFVSFISSTTSSSISLEGRNFWIMKSIPVHPKEIFNNKILLNLILIVPITFLAITILKFTLFLTIGQVFTLYIITIIFSLVASHFGLLVNLKFPKMDAINDATVVKRSISSIISLLVPMVLIFTISGIYSELSASVNFNILLFIIIIIMLIILFIERILINNWAIKRFREIN